jgi:hypothetical protein
MRVQELLYGLTEAELSEVGIAPPSGYGGAGPGAGMMPPAAAPPAPMPGPGMTPQSSTGGGQFQTAGIGSDLANYFMSGPKPVGGAAPQDPLHGSPTAAGSAAGSVLPGMGTVNNAMQSVNQPQTPTTK